MNFYCLRVAARRCFTFFIVPNRHSPVYLCSGSFTQLSISNVFLALQSTTGTHPSTQTKRNEKKNIEIMRIYERTAICQCFHLLLSTHSFMTWDFSSSVSCCFCAAANRTAQTTCSRPAVPLGLTKINDANPNMFFERENVQ